ncbi:MAG: glycosyltransferase [Phycisphaerales bacterium]|nr:glycosyltransferase [Phycisphaerales bacterium]
MLIILPDHLRVSGITTWALNAIRGLRAQSIDAGLLVHTAPGDSVPEFLAPYVISVLENAPSIHTLNGNIDLLVEHYLGTIKDIHKQTGKPVIVSPNLHGDCYGAIAQIAIKNPELVRVLSWIHSDNEYDSALCRRYDSIIHAVVPVSRELESIAKRTLPHRQNDIVHIPYPVQVELECPNKEPQSNRAIRLVYTGRLDEYQKRISVLPLLTEELDDRGIDFEFKVVGDGEEMDSLIEKTKQQKQIEFIGSVPPDQVKDYLQWADLWILPSRYEGQSVAMLEALANGCIPIVTQVRSGADDAVQEGTTGFKVDSIWNTPIEIIASRMADIVESVSSIDLSTYATNAHKHALKYHSIPTHIDALRSVICKAESMGDRPWPSDQRASYSAKEGELDASTPHDAIVRASEALSRLAGKRVLIYCSGQHTRDISKAIQESPAEIVGIVDDDPTKAGLGLIGYPIYPSDQIPHLNATDLLISSWIYEDTIWSKRDKIEAMGIRVHRLYSTDQDNTVCSSQ